jgi:assimilatory nitrate reductase catalytic subunit
LKFKELQSQHGRDSVGVYSGSSLTTEKTYLMGKFARAGLGTRYVDYNGRLCMVSAAAGNNKASASTAPPTLGTTSLSPMF